MLRQQCNGMSPPKTILMLTSVFKKIDIKQKPDPIIQVMMSMEERNSFSINDKRVYN